MRKKSTIKIFIREQYHKIFGSTNYSQYLDQKASFSFSKNVFFSSYEEIIEEKLL